MKGQELKKQALRFVLIVGIVRLFADMTYEGARAINGPFLGSLGASAAVVGLVAGLGELLGYGLRSIAGYVSDRTHQYWTVVFLGYFINVLAVPALALAGAWPIAAALMVAERTGKAIRQPSVGAMIAHAGKTIGHGWAFGLNEALDQTGATAGPLLAALFLSRRAGYQHAYAILAVPAVLCLLTLAFARVGYPRPHELEERRPQFLQGKGFSKAYWIYVAGGALIACGFADFSLIAFHFQRSGRVASDLIPAFYAAAMGAAALASLILGKLLDRVGFPALLAGFTLPVFSAPLVFLGSSTPALAGMVLWGIGMGAQDASLKAVVAGIVPPERRSTAFGVFDTGFGVAWFLGSAAMGLLYEQSIGAVVVFSMVLQGAALPVLYAAGRREGA
jgi:predicted MFS family arabinose efflux permease